jgi:pimeloyl-ACP methyl ester carboxylesterase
MPAIDPISSGVRFLHHRIEVEDGVTLTVFDWDPGTGAEPLVFVAGWVSVIEGWRPLLEVLVREQPVVYIETREKRSAVIRRDRLRTESFAIPRLGRDVIEVCNQLEVDPARRVFFASSMGSNAVLEALKHDRLAGRGAFLIGPNAEFRFPAWGRALTYMPASIYHLARPFMVWYLERFRVNVRDDPEQMARYRRTLKAAHPVRLKLSARAVLGYSLLPDLDTVRTPVAIAYSSADTLHGAGATRRLVDALPHGEAVECPTNTYMHTAAVADDLTRFIEGLRRR